MINDLWGAARRDGRSYANDNPNNAAWLKPASAEMYRVLKPDRFCISFYGFTQAEKFLIAWKSAGFRVLEHIVFQKRYYSSEGYVQRYHESAYLLAKGKPDRPRISLPSVLDWRYTQNELHPTQKPTQPLYPLIMAFSKINDVVLDPFAGSGSVPFTAEMMNRRYVVR